MTSGKIIFSQYYEDDDDDDDDDDDLTHIQKAS